MVTVKFSRTKIFSLIDFEAPAPHCDLIPATCNLSLDFIISMQSSVQTPHRQSESFKNIGYKQSQISLSYPVPRKVGVRNASGGAVY